MCRVYICFRRRRRQLEASFPPQLRGRGAKAEKPTHSLGRRIHGAGQELGLRGGTLPSPLIVSFGKAISAFPSQYKQHDFLALKKYLRKELTRHEIHFIENGTDTIPHIMSLTFPTIDITTFIQKTRELFCIAQGSACSSKEMEPSHVLKSISINRGLAERTIRLSFDFQSEETMLKDFITRLN